MLQYIQYAAYCMHWAAQKVIFLDVFDRKDKRHFNSLNCQLNAISDQQSSVGVCGNSQPESYAEIG